jgi:MFS family permease
MAGPAEAKPAGKRPTRSRPGGPAYLSEALRRYRRPMPVRTRIIAFGSAGALVVAGVISGILVAGVVGQALAMALIGIGLGGALLLLFLEVGLSEDQARAREERLRRRRAAQRPAEARRHTSGGRGRRRP